jgi:predicted dehydrogenase
MPEAIQPVRIGVVGTSFISGWLAEAAAQTDCCRLAAVCSRSAERGAAFAGQYGLPMHFGDLTSLLDCGALDAVYLASPNFLHYRQALAALEAGKHVLCEKPLALNAAQGEAMFAPARRKGLVLLEAIRPVFDPFLTAVRQSLPRIGRVRRAAFEFCQYSSRYDRFKAGEYVSIFDASLGNAALLDLGVYGVHVCAALFGAPKAVHAASSFLPNGTEAAGTLLLDYGDMQAAVAYSKVSQSVFPSFIEGEAGTLVFDTLNQPSYVSLHPLNGEPEALPACPLRRHLNMVYELEAFCRFVRGGESTAQYDAQSLTALRIMDEARKQTGVNFGVCEAL